MSGSGLGLYALAALMAYLLGSIPFGLILTKAAGLGDIRRVGSGNIGATNVLRTGSKWLAAATLTLDGGKGALAVGLTIWLAPATAPVAAVAAVLGHVFPVWLGFRGGKGVATALGVLLALTPLAGLIACLTWLAVAITTRFSSLAALVSIALSPLVVAFAYDRLRAISVLIVAAVVVIRHYENIRRLLAGAEGRIRFGSRG